MPAVLTVSAVAELLLWGSSGCAGSMVEGPGSGVVDVRDVTLMLLKFSFL